MPYTQKSPRLGLTSACPLHLALKGQSDARTDSEDAAKIAALCEAFPEALLMFDERGALPVHLGAGLQAPEDVARVLLRCVDEHRLWACLLCQDKLGLIPLEIVLASGAAVMQRARWCRRCTPACTRACAPRWASAGSRLSPAARSRWMRASARACTRWPLRAR